MQNIVEILDYAQAKLFAGDYPRALHAYCALVTLQPSDLDARLRVADTLLAMGEVPGAAFVYMAVAKHAANGGHPLRAIVAIKILEALDVSAADDAERFTLIDSFAKIYHASSERIGRGSRLSLADTGLALQDPVSFDEVPPLEELLPYAAKVAADTSMIAAYPEKVPPVPLLSRLPEECFARVLESLSLERKRPGEAIVSEGEPGEAFYVIARGQVKVTKGEAQLATLSDGAVFGEMALVSSQPRSATVTAATACDVLRFEREGLRSAARDTTRIAEALSSFTRERLLNNLMNASPLFSPLNYAQRVDLMRRFTAHELAADTPVIREGEQGQGLYVLLAGKAQVSKRDDVGGETVLATLEPGSIFGEISLILDEATSASVITSAPSTVLFLARELFQKLADAVPAIRDYVESIGDERMMDTELTMAAPSIEIALDDF